MVTMQAWGDSPSTGVSRKKKLIQTSLQLIGFFPEAYTQTQSGF